jgi:pyruvate/2-oxoglutarate dehydrogenase complex dihydrolipoamide acyltransferase (E2) component
MGRLLFVSQAMLDSWAGQGNIDFVGNVMTLLAGEGKGRSYALDPAVRFLKVLGGDADPNGLVHKVKTVVQLKETGAELVDDSCILGDVGYEVQPGFLAEASALQAAATAAPARPAAPPPPAPAPAAPAAAEPRPRTLGGAALPKDLEEKRKEAEALARFLLENLS